MFRAALLLLEVADAEFERLDAYAEHVRFFVLMYRAENRHDFGVNTLNDCAESFRASKVRVHGRSPALPQRSATVATGPGSW